MEHEYDRNLNDVALVQHLGSHHGYHSSNELEDFDETHRKLHGAPTALHLLQRERVAQWLALEQIGDPDWWDTTFREDRREEFRVLADGLLAAIHGM